MTFSPEIRAFCMPTPWLELENRGKVKPSKYIIPKTELKLCYNVEKGSLKKTGEKLGGKKLDVKVKKRIR